MPKYKESSVTGESWRRSFQIVGSNEYGEEPTIQFSEEDIFILPDNKVVNYRTGSNVGTTFTPENSLTQFQLRNPETEEYIDSYATYKDLFVLLHSLYFHLAKKRDAGPQPYPSWIYNYTTQQWEAPVPKPDGDYWVWDEGIQQWIDPRTAMPDDGQQYEWVDGNWQVVNNAT